VQVARDRVGCRGSKTRQEGDKMVGEDKKWGMSKSRTTSCLFTATARL
jgi:hypothetical protein